jgi:hypothetical protein
MEECFRRAVAEPMPLVCRHALDLWTRRVRGAPNGLAGRAAFAQRGQRILSRTRQLVTPDHDIASADGRERVGRREGLDQTAGEVSGEIEEPAWRITSEVASRSRGAYIGGTRLPP